MMVPSCERIEELAKEYPVVPVCKELYADIITPIALLRKLAQSSKRYFLLESVEGGERWSRYSFLGFDPVLRITCKNGVVSITGEKIETFQTDHPLEAVRSLMKRYRAPQIPGLPPFSGGLVGYFAYSMMGYAEPTLHIKEGELNDFDLLLYDKVIAFDQLRQKICVVVNMKTDKLMENYGKASGEVERIIRMIQEPSSLPAISIDSAVDFHCNVTKEEYCQLVERTKEYIRSGDIFQAVISRRFQSPYTGSLLSAYRVLRTTNPSPYMVYLNIDGTEVVSASPETLVRLQDGRLTTFPVAGSRPRGATEQQDRELEAELLADQKELAEHNMLVDLARNDLGRISKFSTVEVTRYQMIHRYSKIMHITSCVEGNIREDRDACDAIEAVLPAGTLSGAPKIRACEIIEEMEAEPRGIYGGALGYLDFSGNLDTCIAIRMAVNHGGTVTVQAGGGIVADSVPEMEYEEAGNKAQAIINAIMQAGEVDR
ncbi:anthranilate synthase component I [Oscillospiraceae bacterium MB08-C2-2]|nr:anthranilate synthase component I [Oscillospiraceae bacterium MB08-C2-2]